MAGFEKVVPMARFEKVVPMARFEKIFPRGQEHCSTYSVWDKFTAVDISRGTLYYRESGTQEHRTFKLSFPIICSRGTTLTKTAVYIF